MEHDSKSSLEGEGGKGRFILHFDGYTEIQTEVAVGFFWVAFFFSLCRKVHPLNNNNTLFILSTVLKKRCSFRFY